MFLAVSSHIKSTSDFYLLAFFPLKNKTKTDAQLVSVTTSTVNILGGKHIHQEITLT